MDRVSGAGETLSDVAQFYGRATEPVDKKEPPRPSGKAKAFILDMHPVLLTRGSPEGLPLAQRANGLGYAVSFVRALGKNPETAHRT